MIFPEQLFVSSNLPITERTQGKVRDIYALHEDRLLLVTTDRLSAFDRILGSVPYKGQVLNQLSAWWFGRTRQIIPNHLLALPDPNAAIVRRVTPLPIEVVVRGYISGVTQTSLWYRYALGERNIYGYRLPEGLQKNQALPRPMITPTTKGGPTGHDERLTCAEVTEKGYLDADTWERVMAAALQIFTLGQQIAFSAGLILVDTKYEFGRTPEGEIVLIDEVHTPDSSRFWLARTYAARLAREAEPEYYDKEFIRLEYAQRGYRGNGEPPEMPADLWLRAAERYINIYERLTSQKFTPGDYPVMPRLQRNLQQAGILP
ncbi:MAG: phosphoribosylaminoimidazolesuccinocarboxamide synthase [Anaerolineales bacterium]